jgi:FtsP/CotA-like multicopper oxidase with cupredoxin domain
MSKYKILNLLVLLTLVLSLFMSGNDQALAQTTTPPGQANKPEKKDKITQADREAAAARAAADGFTLEASAVAAMEMGGMSAVPRYFSHPNYANSPLPRNVVADWNAIAQDLLQPPTMAGMPMPMDGISMATAFVYLSYMQAAVYDALVAIEGGYQPYAFEDTLDLVGFDASREAAVAAAAFGVLNNYVPSDTLTGIYGAMVAAIADSPAKDAGLAAGQAAADAIIALRAGDGLLVPSDYQVPAPGPGVWQPNVMLDMEGNEIVIPPVDPWMAQLTPFLRATPEQYRPAAPYALTSAEYATDVNEVKNLGGAMSMSRTPEQTAIANFWTTNMVIQMNVAYRQLADSHGMNLLDTARLMALGNMAASDSLILTFDTKYTYNFWRPMAAIRNADVDGNDATEADPTWMPAVMTPNFPEYITGHSSFMSAQAEVLTHVLGTDLIAVDLISTATNTTRHFATASDLRTEVGNARIWGGLHFRTSNNIAEGLGQQLVVDALATNFLADPGSDTGEHAAVAGGIRKFVDTLPGLTEANANNLGQYLPVAVADTTTYPGSDYYEIAVIQYEEKLHSDLPPTLLRGYVQLSTAVVPGAQVPLSNVLLNGTVVSTGFNGVTPPNYLGPTIVATKDKPVRIKFYNLLPTGVDGNLFIPVDTTVMGSGMGQYADMTMDTNPQVPMCDMEEITADCYTENRATLHLHGGISPWISDGTPHQWVTPANEITAYPEGVSVVPVPDMDDSGADGDGVMTFYYTNQQSARLMFYHDHAWGITRLNVYAGEAAPYIIQDDTEKTLLTAGLIPGADSTIPLVIQDKTFVPSIVQLAEEDETWDMTRWGDTGDLWLPHVYSPAQNPGDSSGVNQFGRWAYGPWFWPPTLSIDHGPVDNPYFDPNCDPDVEWCEPELMPGTPYNSMGMEAFMDTPVVNGTAYPTLEIDPKSYRFRILNAANDRFFNLSLYQAIDANGVVCDANNPNPAPESTGVACTEVALADVDAALADPTVFPTPAGNEGPSWIQFGTEGGFLPAPVVIPPQPTTWVNDPTVFNAGNVDLHSLLVAPAERADVVVDFSAFAGQTLILYNDAPAAFPARDPRYDYYTGNGDYRDTGGAPSTQAGYGPNTRTVMRIVVKDLPPAPVFNKTALENAFKATTLGGLGVFQNGQHPIIVGQGAYNSAYGTSFQINGPNAGLVQIFNTSFSFKTLANGASGASLTMPLQPKMIQDEMGEAFEHEYGRMSGNLGVESPNPQAGIQNMILYGFTSPPSEIIKGLPAGMAGTQISSADDGTQIWKFTHNGVDTHPIHFHLYDVQLINRVGWDGIIRKPDLNELGWKDTVRVSPLEDTIVALRPLLPQVPWDLPNSIRLLDPSMPDGAVLQSATQAEASGLVIFSFDPTGEPIDIFNHYVNFGWEYVMHCHILSHEEMDMMRPVAVGVEPKTPADLTAVRTGTGTNRRVTLTWVDNSMNETSFTIERALSPDGPWTPLAFLQADISIPPSAGSTMSYVDPIGNTNTIYFYRMFASNTVGDTWDYTDPAINEGASFPTLNLDSGFSNVASWSTVPETPAAPTNLTATLQSGPQILLTWTDNAINESGFVIERSVNGSAFSTFAQVGARNNTGSVSFTDTAVTTGSSYQYRVAAINASGLSAFSNTVSIAIIVPAAPTNVTAGAVRQGNSARVTLVWTDNANNEAGFTIQRSTNATFTANVVNVNVGANVTTYTTGNIARNTQYWFRVLAFNNAGQSAWANATPFPITTP